MPIARPMRFGRSWTSPGRELNDTKTLVAQVV